jgi:Tol biopolymer transport system component
MTPPSTIAHYRVTSKLGEGGMGAVYRATDTKLNRDVAIKVLPDSFAADPDRMARFEREARVLASLNHPNIAAIYGIEQGAIVMELVEGADLAGPVAMETAIAYALQIATALEAAHEKGIVHRDLKPANVKVTADGTVKVLDFGLAKIGEAAAAAGATAENSPTLTFRATQAGVIMGTAAYMSPEQATGKPVDKRADIWSFGVVLCELLTGRRLFEGETISHTLAAVLRDPIDVSKVAAPPAIRALLARCLERDVRRRLRDIGEARVAMEVYLANPAPAEAAPAVVRQSPVWKIAAGVLALGMAGALWMVSRAPGPDAGRPLVQLDLDTGLAVQAPAISPDGSRVVFVATDAKGPRLAMRRLDQTAITNLPGTEGALDPFFSPDGRSVGFFTPDRLKRLPLDGGVPSDLAAVDESGGGSWGDAGVIAAVPRLLADNTIVRIPEMGGSVQPWVPSSPAGDQLGPLLLPHGKGLLFTVRASWPVYSFSLRLAMPGHPESREFLKDATAARFLSGGYLVFHRQGKLFSVRCDPDSLRLAGEPIPMIDDVASLEGWAQYDVSANGTLVYRRGRNTGTVVVRWDASGKQEPLLNTPAIYITPRVSPDGKRLAVVDVADPKGRILIHDLARGVTNPLTLDSRGQTNPVWTPDGQSLIYRSGNATLMVRADGGGQPETLPLDPKYWVYRFSHDGKLVVGNFQVSDNDWDVWVAPVEQNGGRVRIGTPFTVAGGPAHQDNPAFSPDGRFIVYMSNEDGPYKVYVASLTLDGHAAGGKWQISSGAAYDPYWPDRGPIFFQDKTSHTVSVRYTIHGGSFVYEPPRPWGPGRLSYYSAPKADAMPDGKQVIAVVDADAGAPETHLRVVLNFGDEIRRRLAGANK